LRGLGGLVSSIVVSLVLVVASLVAGSTYKYCYVGIIEQLLSFSKAIRSIQYKKFGSELASDVTRSIVALLLAEYLIGLRLDYSIYILYI